MFHIFLNSGGVFSGDSVSEFDLTEDQIRERFIESRDQGDEIWVQGKRFGWEDAEFNVFAGPPTPDIDGFSAVLGAPLYELNGTFKDVTGDFVTGPPGTAHAVQTNGGTGEVAAVFIAHGSHVAAREAVARCLESLLQNTSVTILHEQPNRGTTLIEKFEQNASRSGYAVVIMTADDVGGTHDNLKSRARQNVIFEAGFFFGKLGRDRVAVLYEEGVELPSDIHGLLYIPLDQAGAWRFALAKEMRAAGFDADLNRLT